MPYASNSAWIVSFGRLDWSITWGCWFEELDKACARRVHHSLNVICDCKWWLDATCNYPNDAHLGGETVQIQPTCSSLLKIRSLPWELILSHQEINGNIQLGSFQAHLGELFIPCRVVLCIVVLHEPYSMKVYMMHVTCQFIILHNLVPSFQSFHSPHLKRYGVNHKRIQWSKGLRCTPLGHQARHIRR